MHVYIYEMNILVDLMYWSMYEMIILSESIDSLNVVIDLLWHSLNTDVPSSAGLTCFADPQPYVGFQVAPWHVSPSRLNQKQDV